jgi:hypothetical protein
MRTFRSKTGPFAEQPFYEPAEIESICTDELAKMDLYPSEPKPVRIDRFIEKRFKVQPSYEDLPRGILGFTKFGPKGVEEVVVAKAPDENGTKPAERRLRTTLAHEAGHGLLHAHLFVADANLGSLFGGELDADATKILCRDGEVSGVGNTAGKKPPYRWWEFQANQTIGALLLPKALLEKALEGTLVTQGLLGVPRLPAGRREQAIRLLADIFDVNPVVARIRLEALYPSTANLQLTL